MWVVFSNLHAKKGCPHLFSCVPVVVRLSSERLWLYRHLNGTIQSYSLWVWYVSSCSSSISYALYFSWMSQSSLCFYIMHNEGFTQKKRHKYQGANLYGIDIVIESLRPAKQWIGDPCQPPKHTPSRWNPSCTCKKFQRPHTSLQHPSILWRPFVA